MLHPPKCRNPREPVTWDYPRMRSPFLSSPSSFPGGTLLEGPLLTMFFRIHVNFLVLTGTSVPSEEVHDGVCYPSPEPRLQP